MVNTSKHIHNKSNAFPIFVINPVIKVHHPVLNLNFSFHYVKLSNSWNYCSYVK